MSLASLKSKFNALLANINGSTTINFATTVETGYEALALARIMQEYKTVYGTISNFTHPTNNKFLNQKPGKFRIDRSFKIDFRSGDSFYFAADIEVFGLEAFNHNNPVGILFEVDIVVIPSVHANEVINTFKGYPAPQHIHSAYECKYGSYNKGQLRELLGLKRHLCYLNNSAITSSTLFSTKILKSNPPIVLNMVRPRQQIFFDFATAQLYDLEQIIVN